MFTNFSTISLDKMDDMCHILPASDIIMKIIYTIDKKNINGR